LRHRRLGTRLDRVAAGKHGKNAPDGLVHSRKDLTCGHVVVVAELEGAAFLDIATRCVALVDRLLKDWGVPAVEKIAVYNT
jgi:hypothetical protein